MLFSEYVHILQNHFKSSIGNYELCKILFDFVIIPAKLYNSKDNTEYLTVSEGTVSKIMNGLAPIHTQIRDHIYDEEVLDGLIKNFIEDIVPELNPEKDDLCFQLMEIIKKDNISPLRKANFEMLANPETLASFLAQAFIYAIVTNSSSSTVIEDEKVDQPARLSELSVKGIIDNKRISDTGIIEPFVERSGLSLEPIKNKIIGLFEEVSNIHLDSTTTSTSNPWGLKFSFGDPYSVDAETKKLLGIAAESWDIKLSDDFYDFGGLKINPIGGVDHMGLPTRTLSGNPEEKHKAKLIDDIHDALKQYLDLAPYFKEFESIKCISLALSNNGTSFDKDVRIELVFDKNVLLTAEEIATYNEDALLYLTGDCDYEKQFEIPKGVDYLEYDESENLKPHSVSIPVRTFPFGGYVEHDYEKEIRELLGYFYTDIEDKYIVQVTIDNINQHTSVAFPTVILLKHEVKEIPYSIRSKQLAEVCHGVLPVRLRNND